MKYIDAEKLTKAIEDKGLDCPFALKMERLDTLALIDELQKEQPETEMKSPFTGGKVTILSREEEVTFRGEKIKVTRKYYRCEDTGREFTDSKLDDDMMWTAFRAYCEKKGMTSFTDIILKQEQTEVDLEKEIDKYFSKWIQGASDEGCFNADSQLISIYDCHRIARHFYELGLNARKENIVI